MIARRETTVRHYVDPHELARCRELAVQAIERMTGVEVGMGSNARSCFKAFLRRQRRCGAFDGDTTMITRAFGDTLFPLATTSVEPSTDAGVLFREVEADVDVAAWSALIRWFAECTDFVDRAFVAIGDNKALWATSPTAWPAGTILTPCVLPRLVLGLTRGGSLAGIFGATVKT